jgi:DNA-binding GntR family transcriptional regulator
MHEAIIYRILFVKIIYKSVLLTLVLERIEEYSMCMNDVARDTADSANGRKIAPVEAVGVYERIREDIVRGRFAGNERLKVSALASRYGCGTNPVREALQQLRGEGFVTFSPNRGARVRAVNEAFARNIFEVEVLLEPYLTRWFAGLVTDADIARLEVVQAQIEELNFTDLAAYALLDTEFHRIQYDRHYNHHVVDMWWRHRDTLHAIYRGLPLSLSRRAAILREHRLLIECLKAQDADGAANVVATHVEGSGRHLIEQMQAAGQHRAPSVSSAWNHRASGPERSSDTK